MAFVAESHFVQSPAPIRFEGRKTAGPIQAHPLLLDFLIAASLDPTVFAICAAEPIEVEVGGRTVAHRPDALVLRETGTSVVDLARRGNATQELRRVVASAARSRGQRYEVRRPGANPSLILRARAVWAYHDYPVSPGDQIRVLDFLTAGPVPIWHAERVVKARDPRGVVYAMACLDLIELDLLIAPLTPDSLVRRRRPRPPS